MRVVGFSGRRPVFALGEMLAGNRRYFMSPIDLEDPDGF